MSFKILIIDDDSAFRRILELKLRAILTETEITSQDNLTAARSFLKDTDNAFDLVVLDEHLPDGRGLELLREGWFEELVVLCVSSDTSPEMAGASVRAGAAYFLNKLQVNQPLFEPLVRGIIDRNKIQRELTQARLDSAVIDTVRRLVGTLRHEINNPLGAVLGAAYLLGNSSNASEDHRAAAGLIESSGRRINHVLEQLCHAVSVEKVVKGDQEVFQIPGDKAWEKE